MCMLHLVKYFGYSCWYLKELKGHNYGSILHFYVRVTKRVQVSSHVCPIAHQPTDVLGVHLKILYLRYGRPIPMGTNIQCKTTYDIVWYAYRSMVPYFNSALELAWQSIKSLRRTLYYYNYRVIIGWVSSNFESIFKRYGGFSRQACTMLKKVFREIYYLLYYMRGYVYKKRETLVSFMHSCASKMLLA